MEPKGDFTIRPDNPDSRYVDTRRIESNILYMVAELFKEVITNKGKKKSSGEKFDLQMLEDNLQLLFNSWQQFPLNKPGLNSGGVGEAITRLVALGILEDMPEVGTFSRETEIGTKLLKRPKSRGGKGLVKITTFIGDGGEKTVTFRINTSLDDIDEREK